MFVCLSRRSQLTKYTPSKRAPQLSSWSRRASWSTLPADEANGDIESHTTRKHARRVFSARARKIGCATRRSKKKPRALFVDVIRTRPNATLKIAAAQHLSFARQQSHIIIMFRTHTHTHVITGLPTHGADDDAIAIKQHAALRSS